MNNKPAILAEYEYNRAIAAIPHLVETMNWLIKYVANLKGEDGIKIKDSETDHPSIELNIEGEDGITVEKTSDKITIKGDGGSGGSGVKSLNELTGELKLEKEDDTNITFKKDGDDTIKIGVYYL